MTEQEWLTTKDPMDIYRLIEVHRDDKRIITYVGDQGKYSVEVSDRQIVLWLAACIDLSKHDYTGTYYKKLHRRPWRAGIVETVNSPLTELRLWCNKNQDNCGDPSLPLRAHLLRDVIGNHWQPVPSLDPQCLTLQVLSLAQAAWDDRPDDRPLLDTFRLLMLADALEEAGCTESPILDHFRGADHVKECPYCVDQMPDWETNAIECRHCEGSGILSDDDAENCHIRGCWALDRILGKE